MGFLHTVIVAVDAGMEGCKGHGDPHYRKERRTARFHQNSACQKFCVTADQKGQHKGHGHRNNNTGSENGTSSGYMGGNVL